MTGFAARLAFAHRVQWERDVTYRAAVLLGPAPVIGCLIGAGLWFGIHATTSAVATSVPWAHPTNQFGSQGHQPTELAPWQNLPSVAPDGRFAGLIPGWLGSTRAVSISATLDVNVQGAPWVTTFMLSQPKVDVAEIIKEGPKTGLFAGVGVGAWAVGTAGHYALSARLERASGTVADCLVRLGTANGRVISAYEANLGPYSSKEFEPAEFDLKPGLYKLNFAFGCWHNQQMTGPATLTILIRHPGDAGLQPAGAHEILRPAHVNQ